MTARTIVQIPCGDTQQGAGCVEVENRWFDTREAARGLVEACGGFRPTGRKYGHVLDWYQLYAVVTGIASRKVFDKVRRRLCMEDVQSTPTDILAWQIRSRQTIS